MSEMCTSSFVPTQVCAFTCLSQQIFSPHLFTLSFEGVKQELYRAPICQNWKYLRMIHENMLSQMFMGFSIVQYLT